MKPSEYPCEYMDRFDGEHPEKYIERKLDILRNDFKIRVTEAERRHMKSLKTVIAIDNAVRKIITDHWDADENLLKN